MTLEFIKLKVSYLNEIVISRLNMYGIAGIKIEILSTSWMSSWNAQFSQFNMAVIVQLKL